MFIEIQVFRNGLDPRSLPAVCNYSGEPGLVPSDNEDLPRVHMKPSLSEFYPSLLVVDYICGSPTVRDDYGEPECWSGSRYEHLDNFSVIGSFDHNLPVALACAPDFNNSSRGDYRECLTSAFLGTTGNEKSYKNDLGLVNICQEPPGFTENLLGLQPEGLFYNTPESSLNDDTTLVYRDWKNLIA